VTSSYYLWPNSLFIVTHLIPVFNKEYVARIILGSDRLPETKQGIEGKIARFRSGRLGIGVRIADLTDLKLSILAPVKFRSPI